MRLSEGSRPNAHWRAHSTDSGRHRPQRESHLRNNPVQVGTLRSTKAGEALGVTSAKSHGRGSGREARSSLTPAWLEVLGFAQPPPVRVEDRARLPPEPLSFSVLGVPGAESAGGFPSPRGRAVARSPGARPACHRRPLGVCSGYQAYRLGSFSYADVFSQLGSLKIGVSTGLAPPQRWKRRAYFRPLSLAHRRPSMSSQGLSSAGFKILILSSHHDAGHIGLASTLMGFPGGACGKELCPPRQET